MDDEWRGDEPVIDLDIPVDLDEESLETLERETRQFVFNVLFLALVVIAVIVAVGARG